MRKSSRHHTDPKVRRAIANAVLELVEQEGGRGEVTRKYKIHGSQISDIVNDGRAPRVELLIKLADALGRSVDSILGR